MNIQNSAYEQTKLKKKKKKKKKNYTGQRDDYTTGSLLH